MGVPPFYYFINISRKSFISVPVGEQAEELLRIETHFPESTKGKGGKEGMRGRGKGTPPGCT